MSNINNRNKLQLIQLFEMSCFLAALHFPLETNSFMGKKKFIQICNWIMEYYQIRKIKKIPLLEIPLIRNILAKFIGSV